MGDDMASPLLITKLHIPSPRPNLVPRPRLVHRLEEGLRLGRKLTLISAPAGFGKTTLLSEWAGGCGWSVAWVSLDKADNDPARFWAYVIAALQTIHEDMGAAAQAALQSPQPPPIELLLTGLVNEITEVPDPFALVLDDFHVITEQQVRDALTFLLDNLPPQMHLILASRADPPWPLARLRARREMTELRADDLRFTSEEAAAFLNEVMKLDLSAEDVARLEARTEGWIVGLQMAALSMRGQRDVSGFIKAFTGSHRFILDYLVEEVLDQQPPGIQDFLLKTSILDRMTAPLCDAVCFGEADTASRSAGSAVTGREDSQAILEHLAQANLFLVPLDDERRWYRYHRLFADLLRSRLKQDHHERVCTLHCRASAWCEGQGLVSEAVRHALAAVDVNPPLALIGLLAILPVAALILWRDDPGVRRIAACGLFLLLGSVRYALSLPDLSDPVHVAAYRDQGEVVLRGRVVGEPDVRDTYTNLCLAVDRVQIDEEEHRVKGRVLVRAPRCPRYMFGDALEEEGKLETPSVFEGFSFRDYLARRGIHGMVGWPEIRLLSRGGGSPVYRALLTATAQIQATIARILPEREASLFTATLLGVESDIPQGVRTASSATGTTHVIAISGFN
jgi:hypothetical protein